MSPVIHQTGKRFEALCLIIISINNFDSKLSQQLFEMQF